jgi:hypothetical protein
LPNLSSESYLFFNIFSALGQWMSEYCEMVVHFFGYREVRFDQCPIPDWVQQVELNLELKRALGILFLAFVAIVFCGCQPPAGLATEAELAQGEPAADTPYAPPAGPCCDISYTGKALEIFIDGVRTEKQTPVQMPLLPGTLVSLSSTARPGVSGFLITQGEVSQSGVWVVSGDEKYIRFDREKTAFGQKLIIDTGQGTGAVSYDLNSPTDGPRVAVLFEEETPFGLFADLRKNFPVALLRGWNKLWALDLSQTGISDLSFISDQNHLRQVVIRENSIDTIAPLKGLSKLRVLDLTGNPVSDLGPLSGLTNMRVLNLRKTKVGSVKALSAMQNLTELNLAQTSVSDLWPLAKLTGLKSLMLAQTQVSDIQALSKMTELEFLNLDETHVTDLAPLADLHKLKVLYLRQTNVADLSPLAGHVTLEEVYIDGTQVTDISALKKTPKLHKLGLTKTPVADLRPLHLLKEMGKLTLSGSNVPMEKRWEYKRLKPFCQVYGLKKME